MTAQVITTRFEAQSPNGSKATKATILGLRAHIWLWVWGVCKNGTRCGLSAAIRKSIGSPGAAKDIHSTFLEDSLERFKEPLQTHPERNLVVSLMATLKGFLEGFLNTNPKPWKRGAKNK